MKMKIYFTVALSFLLVHCVYAQSPADPAPLTASRENIRCSADGDCRMEGFIGRCVNPGQKGSGCVYQEITKVHMIIISPKACRTCNTEYTVNNFKTALPGLEIEYLKDDEARAKELISELKIEILPAYIFLKDIEKDINFSQLSQALAPIGEYYYVNPSASGVSFFLGRPRQKGRLDLFLVIAHADAAHIIKLVKELRAQDKNKADVFIHLLGLQDEAASEFVSAAGPREIDEDRIYACVDKYYPNQSFDYLNCRVNDIDSLWWEKCLEQAKLDSEKIKSCARGEESSSLFAEKIKLAQELKIIYGPLFLFENIEVFGITQKTTAEEITGLLRASDDTQGDKGKAKE